MFWKPFGVVRPTFPFPDCFLFRTVRLQRPGIALGKARPKIVGQLNQNTRLTTYWSHQYLSDVEFKLIPCRFWLTYPFSCIDILLGNLRRAYETLLYSFKLAKFEKY